MNKELIRKKMTVAFAGFMHAVKCTIAMALLAISVALLCLVPFQDGYVAVLEFFAAVGTFLLSLMQFHSCGKDLHWGRFSK